MSEYNLPASISATSRLGPRPSRLVPGSWWRVTGPVQVPDTLSEQVVGDFRKANDLATEILERDWSSAMGAAPDHGVVLLLKEVRVVDDEIHTLILGSHPGWEHQGEVRMLSEHFELVMTEVYNGPELRAREELILNGHIAELTARMGDPPDAVEMEGRVSALLEKHSKEEALSETTKHEGPSLSAEQMRTVPAVLLPSRDIVEAERKVRREIAKAQVLGEMMGERVGRVNDAMSVVVRFKSETATVAMSQISGHLEMAKRTMDNVHTLKLWIGEDIDIHSLVDGRGAGEDAKIHFMQQLLYLDEEIFAENMSDDGFTSDNMANLSGLLQDNPGFVSRMMPYERCVAIARVRRHDRYFPETEKIQDAMRVIAERAADKRIFLLVRDGDRVSLIVADNETSGAQRLFPSDREIDGIYTSNGWKDRGAALDVADVRYSDARRKHESRALFYKRFLLILWGAHEREGVFGALPRGMNWLTAETHMEWFKFIHDEETGIAVDRLPVRDWIAQNNARIRPGSRVLAKFSALFRVSERAPGAWNNPLHHNPEQIRVPLEEWGSVIVGQRDDDLVIQVPSKKIYSWDEDTTRGRNVSCILKGGSRECRHLPDDVFVIDDMSSARILEYVESRKERQSHTLWMHAFSRALPLVRGREAVERALRERIEESPEGRALSGPQREMLGAAVHEAVIEAGWELPDTRKDSRVLRLARCLAVARDMDPGAHQQVRVSPAGNIQLLDKAEPLLDAGIPEPIWKVRSLRIGAKGDVLGEISELRPLDRYPRAGTILLHDATDEGWVREARCMRAGVKSPEDRAYLARWIERLEAGPVTAEFERLSEILDPQERIDPDALIREIFDVSGDHVIHPEDVMALAPVLAPVCIEEDQRIGLGLIIARSDPVYRLFLRDREAALQVVKRVYKRPERALELLEAAKSRGKPIVSVSLSQGAYRGGLIDMIDHIGDLRVNDLCGGTLRVTPYGQKDAIERDFSDPTDLAGILAYTCANGYLGSRYRTFRRSDAEAALAALDRTELLFGDEVAQRILSIMPTPEVDANPAPGL